MLIHKVLSIMCVQCRYMYVPLLVCVYVGIVLHKDVFIYWVE